MPLHVTTLIVQANVENRRAPTASATVVRDSVPQPPSATAFRSRLPQPPSAAAFRNRLPQSPSATALPDCFAHARSAASCSAPASLQTLLRLYRHLHHLAGRFPIGPPIFTMSRQLRFDFDPDGGRVVVDPPVRAPASPAQPSAQRGAHPSARSPTQSRAIQPPQTSRAGHSVQPSDSSTTSALVHSRPSASSPAQPPPPPRPAAQPSASSAPHARVDRQLVPSSSAQPPLRTQPTAAEAYESDLTYSETDEPEADESEADEFEADEFEAVEPDVVEADAANADAPARPATVSPETEMVRTHLTFRHWVEAGCLTCRALGITCEQPDMHLKQEKCKHCSLKYKPCSMRWILYMPRVIQLVHKLRHVDLSIITPEFLAAELEVYKNVSELGGSMDRCKEYSALPHSAPADHPVERLSSDRNDTDALECMTSDRNAQTLTPPLSSEPQRGASTRRKRTFDAMLNEYPPIADPSKREAFEVITDGFTTFDMVGSSMTHEQRHGVFENILRRVREEMD